MRKSISLLTLLVIVTLLGCNRLSPENQFPEKTGAQYVIENPTHVSAFQVNWSESYKSNYIASVKLTDKFGMAFDQANWENYDITLNEPIDWYPEVKDKYPLAFENIHRSQLDRARELFGASELTLRTVIYEFEFPYLALGVEYVIDGIETEWKILRTNVTVRAPNNEEFDCLGACGGVCTEQVSPNAPGRLWCGCMNDGEFIPGGGCSFKKVPSAGSVH